MKNCVFDEDIDIYFSIYFVDVIDLLQLFNISGMLI